MSDETNESGSAENVDGVEPKRDEPQAESKADAPGQEHGFAVSVVAPDGSRRDWDNVGGYLVVAFDREGRIKAVDSNMPTEGVALAVRIAERAFVDAPLDMALAEFAKRESRKRPGIITASGMPPTPRDQNGRPRNGRIMP